MASRIWALAWLAIIPLVPTMLLWVAFDNSAQYNTDTFKLGGSIAGYLALYSTFIVVFFRISVDSRKKLRRELAGKWFWRATARDAKGAPIRRATGYVFVERTTDDQLTLRGEVTWASDGTPNMTFGADEIVLTEGRLVYFYETQDRARSGIVSVMLIKERRLRVKGMSGRWISAGDIGAGTIDFQRTEFASTELSSVTSPDGHAAGRAA